VKIQDSPQLLLCCLLFVLPLAAKTCDRKEEPVPESLFLTRADSNLIPLQESGPNYLSKTSGSVLHEDSLAGGVWGGGGGAF
jgi:hypothetical protein